MCYRPGRTHSANDAFPHGSAGLELCREISVEGAARREKYRADRRVEEKGRDRGKIKALESREGEEREEQASRFPRISVRVQPWPLVRLCLQNVSAASCKQAVPATCMQRRAKRLVR